jgi:TonB-dependent receptor
MAAPVIGGQRLQFGLNASLRCGVSALAMSALWTAPAYGQTTEPIPSTQSTAAASAEQDTGTSSGSTDTTQVANGDEIVITGIRQSLANSQNIKRNADTVVDAITAQDIGALPDRSVTEALQRVPGVSINRFAGSNDPDHFSVEGSGVAIRGLTYVRSEFNGRDTFSTGVYGEAINFADVPAELLGSVEVYKNSTADLIEGGLSGSVNMNLRLPFDQKGLRFGFDLEANYSDLAERWSPVGSILASNTWDTDIGRIGLLGAASYSKIYSRSDGVQITNFQLRNGTIAGVTDTDGNGTPDNFCRAPLPSNVDQAGFPSPIAGAPDEPCYGAPPAGADTFADWLSGVYSPLGGQFRTQDFNRQRKGFAAAFQWESVDRRSLLTAQFLRSVATQKWGEHTFEAAPDLSEYNTFPYGCLQNGNGAGGRPRAECPMGDFDNFEYNDEGVFENGYITLPGTGWRSADSGGSWRTPTGGMQMSLARRQVDDRNVVQDHGLNFKFKPDDRWSFNFDAQYVKAEHDNLDVSVFGSNFADQEVDLTGSNPTVIPHRPLTLSATWSGCTPAPGMPNGTCSPNAALNGATDETYFSDPSFTFWRAAMDHAEKSRGNEWAFRADGSYDFKDDIGFLRRVKFGARYADRDQKVKFTTYNWGSLSEVWSGSAVWMDQVGGPNIEQYHWNNFFRGDTVRPPTANYYSGDLIGGYDQATDFFRSVQAAAQATGSTATSWNPLSGRAGVVAGTRFLPTEIQDVSETNKAGYMMLNFGKDEPIFGNVRLDGNIGVRYVGTKISSGGVLGVPSQQELDIEDPFAIRCAPTIPPPPAPQVPVSPGGVCDFGPAGYAQLQQWATGETVADLAKRNYNYWLPSLNLKFGLTNDLILRFAASKNLARPEMAQIRNFIDVGIDPDTNVLTATAGNPFLKPAISKNFDASLEWYFASVGSLTFNAFYKTIHNFFFQDIIQRDITSNGVTQSVFVRGPANFEGNGKVKGFELAYQQTYDFLPGLRSGFGINANYTYIKSRGLPNSRLNLGAPVNEAPIQATNLPLEQLSKHNVNLAAFYEKGPVSLRVAYNWRSRFLLTSSDVIFPYFPIFNDKTGQLDASAFFNVTKDIKVGVQGVNLTNEVTKTLQMFSQDGLLGPRSYFMNDRRFSFILRGTFSPRAAPPPPPPAPPPPPPPPPATQTCADGSVVLATDACPAPPPPPPPPPPAPERG